MAFVEINPRYRDRLAALGLRTAADFLDLNGVIYCGHPNRNVARVDLGDVGAYLKREHRVRRKDRLAAAWAGFGFISKSCREYGLLQSAAAAGIGCPEAIAAGEDDAGRAFLLVAAADDAEDLREFLLDLDSAERRQTAIRLGQTLARMHAAGFDHPDLYAKHVLVRDGGERFCFLDWQRSRCGRVPRAAKRWRDLAALDATLAADLAGPRDRLACLSAYLRATRMCGNDMGVSLRAAALAIMCRTAALLKRRRVQELRRPPLARGEQNLIWLDGEALCVTRQYLDAVGGTVPAWLRAPDCSGPAGAWRARVAGPQGSAELVRRRDSRFVAWLAARLRGKRLVSPELELAGTIFRLQRHGIVTPRLLAVGERRSWPWRCASMLLTELIPDAVPLLYSLQWAADALRRKLMHQACEVLTRAHDAGYTFASAAAAADALAVHHGPDGPRVVLAQPQALRRGKPPAREVAALLAYLGEQCPRDARDNAPAPRRAGA